MLIISGWAHSAAAMEPLAARLRGLLDVRLVSAAEVLTADAMPAADCVVGWSMGGLLALARPPAACRALVLIASTACFCSAPDYDCGTPPETVRRVVASLRRRSTTALADIAGPLYHPYPAPDLARDAGDLGSLAAGMTYLLRTDLRAKVPSVRLPVLLLHGSADALIPAAASTWLWRHLPDSRLELVPGEGHALPLQKAALVAEHIRSFLAALQPSRQGP